MCRVGTLDEVNPPAAVEVALPEVVIGNVESWTPVPSELDGRSVTELRTDEGKAEKDPP